MSKTTEKHASVSENFLTRLRHGKCIPEDW